MKLSVLAVTALAATVLMAGSALAQMTMQPIPNPPEGMHHHMMMKHHHHHHHHHMK